jgi:nucleoside-diphosphate-sugar epimerase
MTGSFPAGGLAVVVGASGGIGAALLAQLQADSNFARVLGVSRSSQRRCRLLKVEMRKVLRINLVSNKAETQEMKI